MNSKGNMTAVEFLIGRWVKTGTLKAEDMFQATQMENEQLISFAEWYSGMEREKVKSAYQRYLKETFKSE